MDTSQEGRTYTERYQVFVFPHIAILDPRTGRLLWRKEGWTQENPFTATDFAEKATDFCSRNSFDRAPQAPRPAKAVAGANKRPVKEMSEEEQMQAAMKASMEEVGGGSANDNDDGDDEKIQYDDNDDDEVQVVDDQKPAAQPSLLDELLAFAVPDEPTDGGSRIQLRMPDGKKAVRKFSPSDPVRVVYAFVAVRTFLLFVWL